MSAKSDKGRAHLSFSLEKQPEEIISEYSVVLWLYSLREEEKLTFESLIQDQLKQSSLATATAQHTYYRRLQQRK